MSSNHLDTLYRQVIMDHYKNPRNKGVLENDSLTINMNNPTCGDRIQLTLKLEEGVVKDAKFEGLLNFYVICFHDDTSHQREKA